MTRASNCSNKISARRVKRDRRARFTLSLGQRLSSSSSTINNSSSRSIYEYEHPSCGKNYLKSLHLKIYKCTHIGEPFFPCPKSDCERRFSCNDELSRHKRTHIDKKKFCILSLNTYVKKKGNYLNCYVIVKKFDKNYISKCEFSAQARTLQISGQTRPGYETLQRLRHKKNTSKSARTQDRSRRQRPSPSRNTSSPPRSYSYTSGSPPPVWRLIRLDTPPPPQKPRLDPRLPPYGPSSSSSAKPGHIIWRPNVGQPTRT
ncbi:unnamed protein product [Trichogramma brassicae]|uniref:C2H2-type domain-containing protein n=1 Tax=Trichogramma brassicae TaxID=86971 RepID=A0A6H5J8X0_9HYME|nr:unnamed protein product [Trichogramma brassicae]